MSILWASTSITLVALVLLLGCSARVQAFDTGHHSDLTREVLNEFGFGSTSIKIAQVENWMVDYYTNAPGTGIKEDLAKLHFDDLENSEYMRHYWGVLASNTRTAVQKAASEGNAMKVLALIGMSLHAVQDFYSHSNWVEIRGNPKSGYDCTTYFDAPKAVGLRSGHYPNASPVTDKDHGDYYAGMNHDSYNRPNWDRAYVAAYAGSAQWVGAIKNWAEKARPGIWDEVQDIRGKEFQTALDSDLKAAYQLSAWVLTLRDNGHWKGWGSGSGTEFGKAAASYSVAISPLGLHFVVNHWHRELTVGLGKSLISSPDLPTMPTFPLTRRAVYIRTTLVEELPVDSVSDKLDQLYKPDFFARIRVDGLTFTEAMRVDTSSFVPHWITLTFIPNYKESIPVRYELFDEDGFSDEVCDINPSADKTRLDFSVNLKTLTLSGDLTGIHRTSDTAASSEGAKPQKGRARIKLLVTTVPLTR